MNSLSKIVPISRGIIYSQISIRSLSTQILRSTNQHYLRSRQGSNPVANSRRFASHSTINLLQQQEQIANNELNNPQAQLEFYKTLLAYNYPHILVQRFETPGIASSPECVQLYIDALNKVGQTAKAAEVARQQQQHQTQYQTNGGNIGVGLPYGFGSRQEPVHVVVSESLLTILSKWLDRKSVV